MNDFISVYENGTHGAGDWKYAGNTWMWLFRSQLSGKKYNLVLAGFLDIESKEDNVYDSLSDEIIEVNQYVLNHSGWDKYDMYLYLYNWLINKINAGINRDWETYKFCFQDATAPFDNQPSYVYIEYPEGVSRRADTTGFGSPVIINYTIVRIKDDIGGYPTLSMWRSNVGWGPYVVEGDGHAVIYNNYPIFEAGDTEGINDYLFEDQDPVDPPGDDPSDWDDTPIDDSDEYDHIINDFLTNFTVLAEMNATNLNIVAEALNNNISLDDSIPEMLAKIGRSIIQKNIAEGVLSIKIIPIPDRAALPYKSGVSETLFHPLGLDPVQGKKLNNTIKKYTIGNCAIHKIFGDYRDFMCEYSIYLPFSGIHPLDADVIVGKNMLVNVDIDFLTGSLLYHLILSDGVTSRDLYQFTGDCAIELPITGVDYAQKYMSIMSGIFSGVGMIAGAAAGGPMGAGAGAALAGVVTTGLKTVGNAATIKGNYMQTGKLVPNSCALSVLYPYLIISKPIEVSPNYNSVKGKPTHKMLALNTLSGFSIVSNINLNSIQYATDEDKDALRSLLANGVYF